MSSLGSWMFRLLLLLSLVMLGATLFEIWPDHHGARWTELAGTGLLMLTTGGVGLWTLAAWIFE